jgi:Ca-activated chloride channel homolog
LPVTYNHGVTAYRSNDFTAAAATFEQATATTDRPLQAKALYNLGNARYRLGQAAEPQSLEQAIPVFKKSLRAYEIALAANPQDADAKINRDLVKRKIVELEKQQERQRQQQSQQNQQDQQKQKNEQQQPQSDPEQQQSKKESEQGKQQPQQEAKPSAGLANFDKQRAAAMLDNLREDERNWNFFPEMQMQDLKDNGETAKDW